MSEMNPRKGDRAQVNSNGVNLGGLPIRYTDRWGVVSRVTKSGEVYVSYPSRVNPLISLQEDFTFMRNTKSGVVTFNVGVETSKAPLII